jgi:hypothetical protein
MKYDLEYLIKSFTDHASKYEKDYHNLEDDYFNLPQALLLFAEEIKKIKEDMFLKKDL